mmetsp:Transcript_18683/g.35507  ORF Transcript_18683/g.35507 Transcript_18683/m.35507 type:complete len:208 (+) Transcript_18683:442-1065(+)
MMMIYRAMTRLRDTICRTAKMIGMKPSTSRNGWNARKWRAVKMNMATSTTLDPTVQVTITTSIWVSLPMKTVPSRPMTIRPTATPTKVQSCLTLPKRESLLSAVTRATIMKTMNIARLARNMPWNKIRTKETKKMKTTCWNNARTCTRIRMPNVKLTWTLTMPTKVTVKPSVSSEMLILSRPVESVTPMEMRPHESADGLCFCSLPW